MKNIMQSSCKPLHAHTFAAFLGLPSIPRQYTFLMMKAKWAWAGRDADRETAGQSADQGRLMKTHFDLESETHTWTSGHMIWFVISFHGISVFWDVLPNLAGTVDVACRGGPTDSWYAEFALIRQVSSCLRLFLWNRWTELIADNHADVSRIKTQNLNLWLHRCW